MTPRQLEIFDFVRERIDMLGVSPTYQQIADHFGMTKSNAFAHVEELIGDGLLARTRARGDKRKNSLIPVGVPDVRRVPTSRIQSELARRGLTFEALDSGVRKAFAKGAVTCAADCCDNEVRRGQLFCLKHWRAVPCDLQDAILSAHRRRDRDGYQAAVAEARDVAAGYGRWQQ